MKIFCYFKLISKIDFYVKYDSIVALAMISDIQSVQESQRAMDDMVQDDVVTIPLPSEKSLFNIRLKNFQECPIPSVMDIDDFDYPCGDEVERAMTCAVKNGSGYDEEDEDSHMMMN